jgi:hypothetical protein
MQADRSGQLYRSLGDAFKKIYTHEGYKGFFRGMSPNIQRGFIVNAAELGTYDHWFVAYYLVHNSFMIWNFHFINSKQFFLTSGLLPDGVFSHFGASLVAGFAGAASSNP